MKKTQFPKLDGLPVDICVFTVATERREEPSENVDKRTLKSYPRRWLELLLVQRLGEPFRHKWALPGGFTDILLETLDEAAIREFREETNLEAFAGTDAIDQQRGIYLEQIRAYYQPDRDPRGRIPTVAYVALVNEELLSDLRAGGDAGQARLFLVNTNEMDPGNQREIVLSSEDGSVMVREGDLAFDHATIILDSLTFVQNKMMTTPIAKTLLPEEFTIAQLHQVVSAVVPSYTPSITNFARDLVKTKSRDGMLEEAVDEDGNPKKSTHYSARPAQLYRFREGFKPGVSIYPRV